MLWTAEAVEDLKRLALEGKSAAISPRRWASGPATLSSARRAGSGSNSTAAAGALRPAPRRRARLGRNGRRLATLGPTPPSQARPVALARDPWLAPGRGRRRGHSAKPRSERCDGCGSRTFVNPPAGGRSAIREAGTSPIAGSRRWKASPIAPAIAGWPTAAAGEAERERAAGISRANSWEFVAGGLRLAGYVRLEDADQAGRVRARFAPRRRRPDEERPEGRLAGGRLDISAAMGEPHRRLELESVAVSSFDREGEQAVRGQRGRDRGEQRREIADIDERVRRDDEIEGCLAARA